MELSLKCSRNHEVIDLWSVRPSFFPHSSVLTHCSFQFAMTSEDEYQCFKRSHLGVSMGLMPWGFRRRLPTVLRSRSWRHWVVLFFSIDEGWWAWPPLTMTCTVLPWLGHVLSMTRDALKSSWNWTGSLRSNVGVCLSPILACPARHNHEPNTSHYGTAPVVYIYIYMCTPYIYMHRYVYSYIHM